jgi:hypothetical protein
MSRLMRLAVMALSTGLGLGAAPPVHAQLGNLIKKQVESRLPPTDPPVFDDVLLELTPERIDRMIKARLASAARINAPDGPVALKQKLGSADQALERFREENLQLIEAWETRLRAILDCRDSALAAASDSLRKQMGLRLMSDVAFGRQLAEWTQQVMAAQQRGDTAAMNRAQFLMDSIVTPVKADSLAADRACGTRAEAPPVPAQYAAMKAAREALAEQLRSVEAAIIDGEVAMAAMNSRQLHVAWERVMTWAVAHQKKYRISRFTQAEVDALEARVKDLKPLVL